MSCRRREWSKQGRTCTLLTAAGGTCLHASLFISISCNLNSTKISHQAFTWTAFIFSLMLILYALGECTPRFPHTLFCLINCGSSLYTLLLTCSPCTLTYAWRFLVCTAVCFLNHASYLTWMAKRECAMSIQQARTFCLVLCCCWCYAVLSCSLSWPSWKTISPT